MNSMKEENKEPFYLYIISLFDPLTLALSFLILFFNKNKKIIVFICKSLWVKASKCKCNVYIYIYIYNWDRLVSVHTGYISFWILLCYSCWMDITVNFDLLQNWTPFLSKAIKQGNLFFVPFAKKCPVAGAKERAATMTYD